MHSLLKFLTIKMFCNTKNLRGRGHFNLNIINPLAAILNNYASVGGATRHTVVRLFVCVHPVRKLLVSHVILKD